VPVVGAVLEHFFQRAPQHHAQRRAPAQADAAHHHHHDQQGRLGPVHQRGADKAVLRGQQRTGQAGHAPGQGKGQQLEAEGGVAQGLHAGFVVADAFQRAAEVRALHARQPQKDSCQRKQDNDKQPIALCQHVAIGLAQQHQRGVERVAIVPAIGAQRHGQVVQHLRKRQGDHQKVHAAGAQCDQTDQAGHGRARQRGHQPDQPGVGKAALHHGHHGIGTDADEAGMAQGHQPGAADQEVEAERGDADGEHAAHQVHVIVQPPQRGQPRESRQQQHQGGQHRRAGPAGMVGGRQRGRYGRVGQGLGRIGHGIHARAGKRPEGLNTSTPAISRYMAMLATAGPTSAARLGDSTSRSSGGSKARRGIDQADQQAGDQRAAHRADAADHHDHEAHDQHLRAHVRVDAGDGRGDHAGHRGEHHAQREHDGVDALDVDAQRLGHRMIERARADLHAQPCLRDQEVQAQRQHDAHARHEEAVHRVGHVVGEGDGSGERLRDGHAVDVVAPEDGAHLLEHIDQPERQQHLVQVVALVEVAEQQLLQQQPESHRDHRTSQNGEGEAAGAAG